jgi:hypothetical protein
MNLTSYLGKNISQLLESEPFKHWSVERTVEDDLDERIIHYVFDKNGLELRCDCKDDVSAVFMFANEYKGFDQSLSEIPFCFTRQQVLDRLGVPSKSGERIDDPILGECGAWDRFTYPGSTIHIEYEVDADAISKITLIRNDIVS